MGLELGARDYELLRKVGRYYLQYEGVVDLEDLLLGPRGTRPLSADAATLAYLRYYVLYLAVGAAEAALRDGLASGELSTECLEEPAGAWRAPKVASIRAPHGGSSGADEGAEVCRALCHT